MSHKTIVVMKGDQTGQELLDEALRVLDPNVIGMGLEFQTFDLSLENRRNTNNEVVYEAARAMKRTGFGLKRPPSLRKKKGMWEAPMPSCGKRLTGK